jgi:phosphopantothenoylcysteine decarboxylase/phosphopantothenate--cysteine ligase
VLVAKGKAKAAPPTDGDAINHHLDPNRNAPEPLAGQPDFDEDPEHRPLFGKHVLVTAGPTHEPIDPVRYIANRSSGKQGFAIAAAAAAAGARVTLVTGPVTLATPPGVERIDVESADEMAAAVKKALPADAAVMVAAVSDWRTKDFAPEKIKKRGSAPPALLLTENPDILATVATGKQRPKLLVGFAAETEDVVQNATRKRKSKGVDWIVANDVSQANGKGAMGGDENTVHLIREGKTEDWEPMTKQAVAFRLVERMAEALVGKAEAERDD